jgi:transcription elongation factor SPT4
MSDFYDHDDEVSKPSSQGIVPKNVRNLRACIRCGLIKTYDQFMEYGCENCPHLEMKTGKRRVEDCTSTSFEGMIALTNPEKSWVARWQGITRKCKGVYAIAVYGDLLEDN